MASTRNTQFPLVGILALDTRFSAANISTTDTTATQAGPTAAGVGVPAAPSGSTATVRAEVEGTGDQDASVVVECLNPGNPGLNGGMRIGYRLASESSTAVRGWIPPNVITDTTSPIYGTTAWDSMDSVVLRTGKILIVLRNSSTTSLASYVYDPTDGTWASATPPTASTSVNAGVALAVDADGYVLAFVDVSGTKYIFRTKVPDDTSSGWNSSPSAISGGATNGDRLRLVLHPTGDWSLWSIKNGANLTIYQFASSDQGATFTLVAQDTATFEFAGEVVLCPSGRIGLLVIDGTTSKWYYTGTPWQSIFTAYSPITISTTAGEIWGALDPIGRIWAIRRSSTSSDLYTYYSDDEGGTWTAITEPSTNTNDVNQYVTLGRMLFALGTCYLLHSSSDNVGTNDPSPILTRLGGWSNVMFAPSTTTNSDDMKGSGATTATNSASWIPISEPDDIASWTAAGTGGDGADSMTALGRLQISTSASTRYFDSTTAPTTARAGGVMEGKFKVTSGGSTAAFRAGMSLRLSDGINATELQIWASTTAFGIRNYTSLLQTVNIDMTTDIIIRMVSNRASHAAVYYRRPYESTWTLAYENASMATTASATTYARWGHVSSSTTVSEWSYVWYVAQSTGIYQAQRLTASAYQVPLTGKRITALPGPLGTGSTGTSNQRLLWIKGKDGPGFAGDTWTFAPRYAHPIVAMLPTVEPSPRVTWRSTSTAEQSIGFTIDPTYTTSMSRNIGLYLQGVNFPTAYLEAWNGASWDTVGTWSGVVGSSLSYARTGNVIRQNGDPSITRYINRGELVGSTIYLGSSKYRKIASHTEGIWNLAGGKHVELVLSGIDGTESSGSSCDIWARQGLLVVHALSTTYNRWRLRIPAGTNADGYYEIGTMALGPMVVFGLPPSWGWTENRERNATRSESRDLVTRVRKLGPTRRTWNWNWQDGVPLINLRDATPTPDYFAHTSTTQGIANFADVPYLLGGLLEELKSGETPVVACSAVPTTTGTTITDPTLLLYGRVASDVAIENVQGDAGINEIHRVGQFAIEELV